MKSPIFIILFAIFITFPQLSKGQANNKKPLEINYCFALDSSENLEGKLIKTKALMTYSTVSRVDGGDSFLYSPKCNNGDYFAVTNFSKLKNHNKWNNFFNSLPLEKSYILEVEFVGKIETSIIPSFGHLAWSRAEVTIIKITSINDITSISKNKEPDYKAETPLTNNGTSLTNLNSTIMFYLLGNKNSYFDFSNSVSDKFILTDKLGRNFYKNNYLKLVDEGIFDKSKKWDTTSVSNGYAVKFGKDLYKVSGKVGIEYVDGKKKELKYENTFQLVKDSWMLLEIKLSEN